MKAFLFSLALVVAGLHFFAAPATAQVAVLRNGDTIILRLAGVPPEDSGNFNGEQTIDESGQINLPYIGKVSVAGNNASAIQKTIENRYIAAGIYTHPTVTINVPTNSRLITVTGEVKGGGRVPYAPDMTVLSAISTAGGFTDFANRKKVQLTRNGKVQIINTKLFEKQPDLNIRVLPGDQIYVP